MEDCLSILCIFVSSSFSQKSVQVESHNKHQRNRKYNKNILNDIFAT